MFKVIDALFNLEGTSGESPVTMRYLLLRKEGLRKLDRKEKANKECIMYLYRSEEVNKWANSSAG